jgi:hypothetical protein
MHWWFNWLNGNAGALQTIAACAAIVLSIITIFVLIATWKAARAQAAAANALTGATERQITILEQQVMAARRQIEESVRPMLDIPVGLSSVGELTKVDIVNLGAGPALDITYAYARFGDRNIEQHFVVPPTIAKDKSFPFTADPEQVRAKGLIFIYRSLSGNDCASSLVSERPHFHYHPDVFEWLQMLRNRPR